MAVLILLFVNLMTYGQAKPKASDLLKSAPFDRITLIDNTHIDVEPISPRPLPVPENKKTKDLVELDEMAKKEQAKRKARTNDLVRSRDNDDQDEMVLIHLLEGESRDFKVKRASIKSVEYFEDMLMIESDRMLASGDYTRAFERLLLVKKRDPNWKGLDEHIDRLLFEEGSAALAEDGPRGLRLLNDLSARSPNYPGLADRLAASYGRRIDRAFVASDFLVARRLLRELDQVAPNHAEGRSTRSKFITKTKGIVDEAAKLPPGDRVDRLADALRVWPSYDGLESSYREAFRQETTLVVAVTDLAETVGPFPRSPAAERVASLLYLPILATDDEAATRGEVGGQLLAGLQVTDLGKGLKIRLKPGATWSDGSRPVTAIDVARSLADRALAASPGYNARWADLLDRVEIVDEDHVEVRLARPSMKPETWLLDPVGPAHASSDGRVSSVDAGRKPVGDGPYRWDRTEDGATLLAATPSGTPAKIRRIREVRYPRPDAAIEALIRGEVTFLERVPPDRVVELSKSPDLKVGAFATPSVHRIALDGRTLALKNRKLRRALSMAIDRVGLLEDFVLGRPRDDLNRPSDGPFVRGSFVDAPDVEPLEHNPLLAKGLVAAAKKELGLTLIKLTFEYPAIAEARAVVPKMVEAFGLVGIIVEPIERAESELEAGLRSGRRFDLAYRASRPTQPLHDAGPLLIPGYDAASSADALASAASPRILQLLLLVDRAPETTSARSMAIQVDRESRDELPVIPLWQVEDHFAWRSTVKGPGPVVDSLYQGIGGWEVEPWLAREP